MKRSALISVFAALALLVSGSVMAQQTKPAEGSVDLPPRGGTIAIPDDGYDGTLASMGCQIFSYGIPGSVTDVAVEVAVEHTWIGDLTFKVVSPAGTVATVMSRPGFDDLVDDGTGCCGDSSDLQLTSPITFSAGGATDAELMGSTIAGAEFVCGTDGLCSYFPNPGSAVDSGDLSTIFDGESPVGDWQFCVGDGAGGDTGNVGATTFTITADAAATAVPTMGRFGLIALVIALALVAGTVLVRRSS